MSVRDYRKLAADDENVNRIQEYVGLVLRPFLSSAILDGVLLQNVQLANGVTEVEHKLGRDIRGYFVIQKSANVDIWDNQATNAKKRISLILNASGACTVSLWVF